MFTPSFLPVLFFSPPSLYSSCFTPEGEYFIFISLSLSLPLSPSLSPSQGSMVHVLSLSAPEIPIPAVTYTHPLRKLYYWTHTHM